MILRIKDFRLCGPHRLWLSFTDGSEGEADLLPLLDVGQFSSPFRIRADSPKPNLDPVAGTIVWPNGADFAPEALRARLATRSRLSLKILSWRMPFPHL